MTVPNETDVIAESSTEEQPVETPEIQAPQEITENVPEQGEVQQKVNVSELSAVDGDGVPMENREAEWRRKYEQLTDRMPEYITQAVQEAAKTFKETPKQETPQYTPEQLRLVIYNDDGTYNAANKAWAQEELDKINRNEVSRIFDEKFQLSQKQATEQRIRAESENYVVNQFPEMFTRDVSGKITGWNNDHELTRLTAKYAKQFKDRPDGLREAARQAFVDYQLMNKGEAQRKVKLAKSENAQLKKQQLSAGGGNADVNSLQVQVSEAFKKFQQSGNVHDAKAYNILKGRLAAMQLKEK